MRPATVNLPAAAAPPSRWAIPRERLENLHPAYFAMVMATGGLSIACSLLDYGTVAQCLFWMNLVFYPALWALTLARVVWFPRRVLADLSDHSRSVGFFTTAAATAILGSQFAVLRNEPETTRALWWGALALWCGCMYGIYTCLIVRPEKPSLDQGINGSWLISVVATQALVVAGCLASGTFGEHREAALFVLLALWLLGGMLYIWTIALVFYRYTFFKFAPSDLTPPYWVNMGAMAMSTLAGALLVKCAPASSLLTSVLPFLKGFTLLFWATATWWIPMLAILWVWRSAVKRYQVRYDPLYWGLVFPLAVYTTCTVQLAGALDTPYLLPLPRVSVVVALLAWTVTFGGLVLRIVSDGVHVAGLRADPAGSEAKLWEPPQGR